MPGTSSLAPAAIYITCILGPLHLASTLGFILQRDRAALAARIPKMSIAALCSKTISFFLISWLFLDPECPCIVAMFMWYTDWIANSWHVLQKVVLLWRCEIQAALEKSRTLPGIAALDENNFFVRYRTVLRPRTQTYMMLFFFIFCGAYNITLVIVYNELAMQPCLTDNLGQHPMVLIEMVLCWVTFIPCITGSTWSMQRLKHFPEDNWKIYWEARVLTPWTVVCALACLIVLIVVPTVDGIVFVHFVGPVWGSLFHWLLPLHLHRQTVKQLAKKEITSLTSFERLLQNENFLNAFGAFLMKEFSSENLYFWLEVERLMTVYGALLPDDQQPEEHEGMPDDPEKFLAWLKKAAHEIQHLGLQCVGEKAPWQINISGFTAQELDKSMRRIHDLSATASTDSLQEALENALKALLTVQHEVFELLRKDPFPRFLLTEAAEKLNNDENFKRMLASEKLDDEAQKHKTSSKHTVSEEGSSGNRGSKGSTKGSAQTKEGKKSTGRSSSNKEKPKKRSSHMFAQGSPEQKSASEAGAGGSRASDDESNNSSRQASPFQRLPQRSTTTTLLPPVHPFRRSESNTGDTPGETELQLSIPDQDLESP